jgi:hypothetical protein
VTYLTTRKASQKRYFRYGGCDCRDCQNDDRKIGLWVGVSLALIAIAAFGTYALLRSFG